MLRLASFVIAMVPVATLYPFASPLLTLLLRLRCTALFRSIVLLLLSRLFPALRTLGILRLNALQMFAAITQA